MKSLIAGFIAAITLTFSATLFAGPYGHGHRYHEHHNHFHNRHWHHYHGWVAPAIIGGAVTYAITRPQVIQQPPVVQQIPQSVVYCTEWKEVMQPNGTIVQERTCTQQ